MDIRLLWRPALPEPKENRPISPSMFLVNLGRNRIKFNLKVSQLRNVALTPPYLHDGFLQKLDEAVMRLWTNYNLGKHYRQT